jgi:hypothetical protein
MNLLFQTDLTYPATSNPYAEMGAAFWVPYTIVLIVLLVAMWKLYQKAGQPGWASIVPIYNLIVFLRIIKRPTKWIGYYIVAFVVYMIGAAMLISSPGLGGILTAIGGIALLVIMIMDYHRLSLSFGKGAGWTVGLILLSFIFIPIMAFSKGIQYVWGDKEIDDHLVTEE